MKIRVAVTSSSARISRWRTFWNIASIDEFAEKFIQGDCLVIGDYKVTISNFVQHSKYIATFNVENVEMEPDLEEAGMCPYRYVHMEMVLALDAYGAPEGRASHHNVTIDHIPDDYDPLANPRAEYDRKNGTILGWL